MTKPDVVCSGHEVPVVVAVVVVGWEMQPLVEERRSGVAALMKCAQHLLHRSLSVWD